MSEDVEQAPEALEEPDLSARRRRRRRVAAALGTALVVVLGTAWLARERIAEKIIADQLASYGLPARYTLEHVGLGHHVLGGVAIGDPARPDLTIERIEIDIVPTFGLPTLGRVVLVHPRLHGSYREGRVSFGTLDRVIHAETGRAPGLPDLDLVVIRGQARIDSDYGVIGLASEGSGNLREGFSGTLSAFGANLSGKGCQIARATLVATLRTRDARLGLSGPLRVAGLSCPGQGLAVRGAALQLGLTGNPALDGFDGHYALSAGALRWAEAGLARLDGKGAIALNGDELTLRYALSGAGLSAGWAEADGLGAEGVLRGREGLARIESQGTVSAAAVRPGARLVAALGAAERAGADTPVGPLAGRLRQALVSEGRASRLTGSFALRRSNKAATLVVPAASLRGSSGAQVLRIERVSLSADRAGPIRAGGQFGTGGAGLPAATLRIEPRDDGASQARLTLGEYRAGDARIGGVDVTATLRRGGSVALAGRASLSGAVPGGRIEDLAVPLDGAWSARRGLALGTHCTALGFARLSLGGLAFERQAIRLCPDGGGPMLASDARGTRFALSSPGLALTGRSGSDPVRIASGRLALAGRGVLAARDLELVIGRGTGASAFRLGQVVAAGPMGGFSDGEMRLAPVPLDLVKASGGWRFADGALVIESAAFTLKDRQLDARFYPLVAQGAKVRFAGGQISAQAVLREPKSNREIMAVSLAHDLAGGRGHADLAVPGVVFDNKLQPTALTYAAQGVIALAKGKVSGKGQIDWTAGKVTSSGRFHTDGLDFAAAFGPTKGLSGTVEFTDLVGLVTAPDQRLRIAAINPGIEVAGGEVSFQLEPGRVLTVNGAHWPFIDGTLDLLPTRMVLGAAEVRRYTLKVTGANAAKFVAQLELGNIAASGVFDGELPLVFDQNGGRIENGLLISRPPGGNVAYVGELSYRDLGTMANFAFQSLRSLDYRRLEIAMEGPLDGEIVSRLRIEGVRQGEGAKKSFVTRSLAGLPIQFNIQIRAPFQRMMGAFRMMYDPTALPDPFTLGLIDRNGKRLAPPVGKPPASPPRDNPPAIQPPVSRNDR